MAEGRDLVKEALEDAKSLKEAAVESAKKELVEAMAPAVRQLLDKSIRKALNEKVGGVRTLGGKVASGEQRAQSRNPNNPDEEARKEEGLELEQALQEFFPADEPVKEEKDMADEKKSSKKSEKKVDEATMGEEIEISEAELRKVYEAALQTEVQVKKGFSDIVGGGELDQASKEAGILDKTGEKTWDRQDPPAKKDWIPEGKVREMIQKGLAENRSLRENLRKAAAMIETLGKKLHEVNLFNAKVLHVNKVLNSGMRLTKEQKTYVMESIDRARSISEVKMVYSTIVEGFKTTTAALTETRNIRPPKADAQRARTSGTPDSKVLSESVDRANNTDKFSRIRELAGLVNGKK
jgi:hypothetical protein